MVLKALGKTGKYLLYLLATLLILVALLAALVRLAVFYGEDYSTELASLVSRYIGSPVKISKIDLVWNRFDASASLSDVRILSRDSRETLLILPSIELELNVREMLMRRQLSARSIKLNNISLVGSYEGRGQLKMHGYEISRASDKSAGLPDATGAVSKEGDVVAADSGQSGHNALSWLFNADRIAILNSDITLIDRTRDKEYKVDRVNIRAFNDGNLHQIRVSSALPDSRGEISRASFDFTGRADNINEWEGQFHVEARDLNVTELSDIWRQEQQTYRGRADVQMWGNWKGTRVNKVRALLNGRDIDIDVPASTESASTEGDRAELQVKTVGIDLDWKRLPGGWEATFNRGDVDFAERSIRLSGLDMYVQRASDGYRHFRIAGPDLAVSNFQPLQQFAGSVGIAKQLVSSRIGSGTINDWLLAGRIVDDSAELTGGSAVVENLQVAEVGQLPGIEGLSAKLLYEEGIGTIEFTRQQVKVAASNVFESELPPFDLQGVVRFSVDEDRWIVAAKQLQLATLDLATSHDFSVVGDLQGKKLLNLNTTIDSANLANLRNYLPAKKIKPKLLNWLQTAIINGDLRRGKIAVSGNLADFSPANGKGVFFGEADIVDGTLKFHPEWPVATGVDGNLTFDARSLRSRIYQGSMREASFSDTRLHISDFGEPVLDLQTSATGAVDDMLDFAQRGPLAGKIGSFFGNATGSGTSRLALDAEIPLRRELKEKLAIDGNIVLDNASIDSRDFGLDLESVSGDIGFNRRGIKMDNVRARYLGVPVKAVARQTIDGEKQINTITMKGPIAIASVLHSYGIPLTDSFEGLSDWQVQIDVTRFSPGSKAQVELTATSDLFGTGINLPLPLSKPSDTLLQAQVYRKFGKDDDWWIEIPGLVKSRVRIGADRKLESMAIALGKSDNTILPWRGIAVHGDVHRLDAPGWVDFALDLRSAGESKPASEAFPLFAKVNTRELRVGTENMGEAVYIAYRDGTHQVHRLENNYADGELLLRKDPVSDEPMVLRLNNLDKLLLAAIGTASPTGDEVTERSLDPREIPPLDVFVKKLKWNNWQFSKVSLRTKPVDRGLAITALTARQDSLRISGNGRWEIYDGAGTVAHATTLDVNASFDDIGDAIQSLGGGETFAEGTGEAALSLGWPSAAYKPELPEMTGELYVNLRNGRILSVEPGAGRILGLFALQALPRRLTLDFRDLVRTGFEYSKLGGNFSIANGFASTQNLFMTGPVAEILVRGNTDFVNRGYNQTVDVLPRVSGALPIIGVLSGGPAAGVTALVADSLLKGLGVNLDEIGRRRYLIGGSWEKPEWKAVEVSSKKLER